MSLHGLVYAFVSAFITLFPVINPIGSGLIVNGNLKDLDDEQRKFAVKRIFVNCLLVGLGSLVAGHLILLLFGLAVPAIQVAGGIVICKTGWDWLSDPASPVSADIPQDQAKKIDMKEFERKLFYPISFPICLGPGSISVIFTLMATANVKGNLLETGVNYAVIGLAIVALLLILYGILSQGKRITKRLGESGNMILNKLIAFIILAIGIQITFSGIAKIFGLTASL